LKHFQYLITQKKFKLACNWTWLRSF